MYLDDGVFVPPSGVYTVRCFIYARNGVYMPPLGVYQHVISFVSTTGCLCLRRTTCLYVCLFITLEDLCAKYRASCNNLQRLRTNKAQDGPSAEDRPPKVAGDFLPQHSLDGTQSSGVRQTERVWAMHERSFSRVYSRGLECCLSSFFFSPGALVMGEWPLFIGVLASGSFITSSEPVYLRCSELVNPGDFHETSRSLFNLPGIFGSILTFLGGSRCLCRILVCLNIPAFFFLAFWDIIGRFLAFSDIPTVFWLYGTFQSFGFLGHPGRFLALWDVPVIWRHFPRTPLESGFKSHPGEHTPLHRSDVGPAPTKLDKKREPSGYLCHFPRREDVSAIFQAKLGPVYGAYV
ncbi:hypothetical protein Taro_034704 [Colocasia esculenta]|uniref:Uncharacterized protein n=1 Tax=Colocasia esculenta TaxID=4460 RepID=A0A843W1M0_COLES|nr:hypothetical protein [Colocasia esculenta]